jgi:hypothetical protein
MGKAGAATPRAVQPLELVRVSSVARKVHSRVPSIAPTDGGGTMKRLMSVLVCLAFAGGFGATSCFVEDHHGSSDGDADGEADDCYVEILNSTGYTVLYLYIADASDSSWGDDVIGDDVMADGDVMSGYVAPNSGSSYDILAEDEDGDSYEVYGFDYCYDGEDIFYELTLDDLVG